ncbi:hypothetical protein HYPP_00104 [Hyphomicrobium sp. ghe19]|nr:hypothetical protein HYPP_00104 [Hyphomicrobium sp. ghe19]
MNDGAQDGNNLTFEQREGFAPLPSQFARGVLSDQLRSLLWAYLYPRLERTTYGNLDSPWNGILREKHVHRDHLAVDEFDATAYVQIAKLKHLCFHGDCGEVLGFFDWLLTNFQRPPVRANEIDKILTHCRSAYRVIDGMISFVGTDEEVETVKKAFSDLSSAGHNGARSHLREASKHLTNGDWAASIRESIHAVESVAVLIEPKATTLGDALKLIEKKKTIHPALKTGFQNIYGFTSDEKGIRHALLEKSASDVDEADALFMIGACAAFVSYLVAKARAAALLPSA